MYYSASIKPSCKKTIRKLCKKNSEFKKALMNKMQEVIEDPLHYKPLKYDYSGKRRVHIMKSFVLVFKVHEEANRIEFLKLEHHDDAYKRK
jgi:YafQ family addiction module toxin component